MRNRYPDDAWLEIIGNCDSQIFLGCTDELTAKFISDRTGETTVGVESTAKEMQAVRLSNYVPSQREVSSIGKRKLMTPDEVLRLPREDALVIFRGQKVLKVKKFDYTKHPEARKLRECNARDYIPNWRVEQESPVMGVGLSDIGIPIPSIKATKHKPEAAALPITTPLLIKPESTTIPAARAKTAPAIPPSTHITPSKDTLKRNPEVTPEEKCVQGLQDLLVSEPFGAIDIDDVLSDM